MVPLESAVCRGCLPERARLTAVVVMVSPLRTNTRGLPDWGGREVGVSIWHAG